MRRLRLQFEPANWDNAVEARSNLYRLSIFLLPIKQQFTAA